MVGGGCSLLRLSQHIDGIKVRDLVSRQSSDDILEKVSAVQPSTPLSRRQCLKASNCHTLMSSMC